MLARSRRYSGIVYEAIVSFVERRIQLNGTVRREDVG